MIFSLNLFFSLLHYIFYAFIGVLVYRTYVRPYLVSARNQQETTDTVLHQRKHSLDALVDQVKHQADYIMMIFKKIINQSEKARTNLGYNQAERVKHTRNISERYRAQQQESMNYYRLNSASNEIESTISANLRTELINYFNDKGDSYITHSIEILKHHARNKRIYSDKKRDA